MKPGVAVASRDHVLFDPKCGNVEAMDHVLRGHDQADVAIYGNMKFINFALTTFMLQLPHPLLADNVDLGCAPRWSAFLKENERAPGEKYEEDE